MNRFPCTLCGSRNWPRENAGCPLCEMPDEDDSSDEEPCLTCNNIHNAGFENPAKSHQNNTEKHDTQD
jgi:hypothetical protein